MVIIVNEFILASQSPRRRELLNAIGLNFEVIVSDADESSVSPEGIAPGMYVQELALIKAAATAKKVLTRKNAVIIAADTIVVLDGKILGKPKDENNAFEMLSSLSGRSHEVYTGYCVMRIKDGFTVCSNVKTDVIFKELNEDEIKSYIRTKEPMDKAGAYGIQGLGGMLIKGIEGDYANVVGLPVSALYDTLKNDFETDILLNVV